MTDHLYLRKADKEQLVVTEVETWQGGLGLVAPFPFRIGLEHRDELVSGQSPVTPEWRPYSVPTAFKKIAERRGARCANASNAVQTMWKRCTIA